MGRHVRELLEVVIRALQLDRRARKLDVCGFELTHLLHELVVQHPKLLAIEVFGDRPAGGSRRQAARAPPPRR